MSFTNNLLQKLGVKRTSQQVLALFLGQVINLVYSLNVMSDGLLSKNMLASVQGL